MLLVCLSIMGQTVAKPVTLLVLSAWRLYYYYIHNLRIWISSSSFDNKNTLAKTCKTACVSVILPVSRKLQIFVIMYKGVTQSRHFVTQSRHSI